MTDASDRLLNDFERAASRPSLRELWPILKARFQREEEGARDL